ncbi:MAG: Sec-independent protein translocase protein TatB [Steroidobacteraceae bacterium]
MFEVGFSELVLIFVLGLIVLGPQRLPKVASQLGRWFGRARAMARQFRDQLEEEINLEEERAAAKKRAPARDHSTPPPTSAAATSAAAPAAPAPAATTTTPDAQDDTFSHAHAAGEFREYHDDETESRDAPGVEQGDDRRA